MTETRFDAQRTVRELALETPAATRFFERLKIDYCCGGGRTLDAACRAAGVEPGAALEQLGREIESSRVGSSLDFAGMSLTELASYVVEKHHTFTTEEMARIAALISKVCGKHGENHAELYDVATIFSCLCDDLRPHMLKEERVLFPYVAALDAAAAGKGVAPFAPFGTVNNPVRMMMFEHDSAGELLRALRAAARDYTPPEDACTSYRALYSALEAFEADLHQHIHLENNVLFPRAVELEASLQTI